MIMHLYSSLFEQIFFQKVKGR